MEWGAVTTMAHGRQEQEDFIIKLIGSDWRGQLERCITRDEWMQKCIPNIKKYVTQHKIIQAPETVQQKNGYKEKEYKKEHLVTDEEEEDPSDNKWTTKTGRINTTTDSQSVCQVLTGKATLNSEGIKPAIRSIVNTFGEWW